MNYSAIILSEQGIRQLIYCYYNEGFAANEFEFFLEPHQGPGDKDKMPYSSTVSPNSTPVQDWYQTAMAHFEPDREAAVAALANEGLEAILEIQIEDEPYAKRVLVACDPDYAISLYVMQHSGYIHKLITDAI